jgi:peptidylprolyl isomerase
MRSLLALLCLPLALSFTSTLVRRACKLTATPEDSSSAIEGREDSALRRDFFIGSALLPSLFLSDSASAAFGLPQPKRSSLYVVSSDNLAEPRDVVVPDPVLSSEICLLKLLPVKNPLFREIQETLEGISLLRNDNDGQTWKTASRAVETSISELKNRRNTLEPAFNPDDDTLLEIKKAERGEQLVETLRIRLEELYLSTRTKKLKETLIKQKEALLALADIGELLVSTFPYDVPTDGKFSYLPRLLGRAKVTFSIRRKNELLGNITIIADGYAAPITAGNFVDLAMRNFYTQLPIQTNRKRLGSGAEFEVGTLPIFGSYNEGFYDPLTARPRRLPLEIMRVEKSNGLRKLAYSQGLSALAAEQATLESQDKSQPMLSFNIPGLIAMNHPDNNPNGASSEFFGLQKDSLMDEKRVLLDGEYAPFGYIIGGYDLFQKLEANDLIDGTFVDEWGILNLVKVRPTTFSEFAQGKANEESENK